MSRDNVQILDVPHRSYDASRDWLTSDDLNRRGSAKVIAFTPRLALCSICSSGSHRASRCPLRPGQEAK